jgi:hypothetical protein
MAMLQRRFASSVYAVHRSLERMRDKRQKILADPEKYRKEQIEDRLPDDFDDLPEDEQMEIEARLEGVVASVDPIALREEIRQLVRLIEHARALEGREIESKLVKLRKVLSDNNVFNDPKMKLLIFTEHKDTLDYLAGDGKDGRPLGKLRQWNLKTTQIHGGMKIGDRDTPGTRIYAEREFREDAQVLLERVKIQRLDAREAELERVEFVDCEVVQLTVDETTLFGASHPRVHNLLISTESGHIEELFDPSVISDWIREHSTAALPSAPVSQHAVRLFERVCRVMLRQHMIKEHPSDASGRFLQAPYWKEIEDILFDAKVVDRITGKATGGAAASFLRMRDPLAILVRRDSPPIKRIWDGVAAIPV